jgi:hypothetical protein
LEAAQDGAVPSRITRKTSSPKFSLYFQSFAKIAKIAYLIIYFSAQLTTGQI